MTTDPTIDAKWAESRLPEDFHRILDPDGSLRGDCGGVGPDELLRWYEVLVETRIVETLCLRMQRRGELSVAAGSRGEEAVGVGAAAALSPGDWCFPSYRQLSALIYWRAPIDRFVASLKGAPPEHIDDHLPIDAESKPAINFVPYSIFLGSGIPHAVGCALADRLHRRSSVTLAFTGEGATSEGDFYEGLNIAGLFRIPLVVIIQNNQWSISVPAHRQTAARTFADKAAAFGIRQSRVDGNDVLAIHEKAKEAVAHARAGEGPTLIEAVTYRMEDHNSADSAAVYRCEEEVRFWRTRDPVDRLERYLKRKGHLTEDMKATYAAHADGRARTAISRARSVPEAPASLQFANHIIGDPGWTLRRQQMELALEIADENPFSGSG